MGQEQILTKQSQILGKLTKGSEVLFRKQIFQITSHNICSSTFNVFKKHWICGFRVITACFDENGCQKSCV